MDWLRYDSLKGAPQPCFTKNTVIAAALGFIAGAAGSSVFQFRIVEAQTRKIEAKIEAKNFVLTDDAGSKRGEWLVDSSGAATLRLYDRHGKVIFDTTPRVMPAR